MHYYNAKSKVIMKDAPWYYKLLGGGKGIAAYPDIFGDSRVGAKQPLEYGGASRRVRRVRRVRGVRRSRRGGQGVIDIMSGEPGQDLWLGGGKRPFRKRTCRSKSRCGGAANYKQIISR
jgi:hypothetical protein